MKIETAKTITKAMIEHNLALPAEASDASYLIPIWWSLPGEGKSTAIADLIKEMGGKMEVVVAAQFDAGEMGGFPILDKENDRYYRARPFFLPTEAEAAREKFIVIFGDELPQAPSANQNIWAQLANERRIGEHKLPQNVVIVCAGNPLSAKAGTHAMPTHLKDRLTHLDIETDHEGFRKYGLAKGFLPEITSYVRQRSEYLQKFNPKENASPSPRSWERVNSILKLGLPTDARNGAIAGQIGKAALADFTGYLRIWHKMPDVDNIISNPTSAHVPDNDPDIMYALCSALAHRANKSTITSITEYIKRFKSKEFGAFCMRDAVARNREILAHKAVSKWFDSEGRELML